MGGEDRRGPSPTQLALELPVEESLAREEFLPAPANAAALAMIEAWPSWPDRALLVVGPEGSGKTHLATIWAAKSGALKLKSAALPSLQEVFAERPAALLLDGLERASDEAALFHLLNYCGECGAYLLMTSRESVHESVRLPDLLSRLRRAPMLELLAPDDALLRAVLEKLFRDRQVAIEPGLVDYLALRLERSLGAARAFVRDLDREALARGRRVTKMLAAELLERDRSS